MDKIKKQLQENYEDALFALMMDNYAQEEGRRLANENREIKNDPDFSLPDGMEERGLKAIRKAFRKQHIKTGWKYAGKVVSRVAVFVLILNIAFGISFFTVEAFRVEVLNMAMNYQETHTTVNFIGEAPDKIEKNSAAYAVEDLQALLSDSYTLTEYEKTPDGEHAIFVDAEERQVFWDVEPITTTINLDTEDADYAEAQKIGVYDGMLVEKNGRSTILWGDNDAQKLYCISADMGRGELLDIIDGLLS